MAFEIFEDELPKEGTPITVGRLRGKVKYARLATLENGDRGACITVSLDKEEPLKSEPGRPSLKVPADEEVIPLGLSSDKAADLLMALLEEERLNGCKSWRGQKSPWVDLIVTLRKRLEWEAKCVRAVVKES